MPTKKTNLDPAVAKYLASLPEADRIVLEELRGWITKAAPLATEGMAYGMPTYLLAEPIVAYKRQKNHFSLYFCGGEAVSRHAEELRDLDVGKGCIRFKKLADLPKATIVQMVKEAAQQHGFRDLPTPAAGKKGGAMMA